MEVYGSHTKQRRKGARVAVRVFLVWISMRSVRTGVGEGIFSLIFREVFCPDEFQVRIAPEMMESCISCRSVCTARRLQ